MSQGREMGKLVYKQPGNEVADPVTARRVPSKLRRVDRGARRGINKGRK